MDDGLGRITKFDPRSPALLTELAHSVIWTLSKNKQDTLERRAWAGSQILLASIKGQRPFNPMHVRDEVQALKLTTEQILDLCVPEAARRLGLAWEDSEASFAHVSIAASRLFVFCKELDKGWSPQEARRPDIPVLLATFAPEQHLLGPAVLAPKLRSLGFAATVLSNTSPKELLQRLEDTIWGAVMISVGSLVSMHNTCKCLAQMRMTGECRTPIIVGGAVLAKGIDKATVKGADLVSNDLDAVAAFIHRNAAAKNMKAELL